jgi:hypothetical protein
LSDPFLTTDYTDITDWSRADEALLDGRKRHKTRHSDFVLLVPYVANLTGFIRLVAIRAIRVIRG